MFWRLSLAGFVFIVVSSFTPIAQAGEDKGWSGEVGLNGAQTTGNNNTTNAGFAFKLKNRGSECKKPV